MRYYEALTVNELRKALDERTKERDAFEMQLKVVSGILDSLRYESEQASQQIATICDSVIEAQEQAETSQRKEIENE